MENYNFNVNLKEDQKITIVYKDEAGNIQVVQTLFVDCASLLNGIRIRHRPNNTYLMKQSMTTINYPASLIIYDGWLNIRTTTKSIVNIIANFPSNIIFASTQEE